MPQPLLQGTKPERVGFWDKGASTKVSALYAVCLCLSPEFQPLPQKEFRKQVSQETVSRCYAFMPTFWLQTVPQDSLASNLVSQRAKQAPESPPLSVLLLLCPRAKRSRCTSSKREANESFGGANPLILPETSRKGGGKLCNSPEGSNSRPEDQCPKRHCVLAPSKNSFASLFPHAIATAAAFPSVNPDLALSVCHPISPPFCNGCASKLCQQSAIDHPEIPQTHQDHGPGGGRKKVGGRRRAESSVLTPWHKSGPTLLTPQGASNQDRDRCRLVDACKSKSSKRLWKASQAIKEKAGEETNKCKTLFKQSAYQSHRPA